MQSCYRCQFKDCTQIFLQKAAACTHVCWDHLNVALACLYCSGRENPKCNGLVLQLGRSTFANIHKMGFLYSLMIPLSLNYPLRLCPPPLALLLNLSPLEVILARAKAAKQCLEEESKVSTSPKHQVKQGPIKKSKKKRNE